jgi:hypothetical protein
MSVVAVPDKYRLRLRVPASHRHLSISNALQTIGISGFTHLRRTSRSSHRFPVLTGSPRSNEQVRALASPTDDLIISASRDSTAILWQKPNPSTPFEQERTFKPGSGYVNAVTIVPPSPDAPKGVLPVPLLPVRPVKKLRRGKNPYVFLIDLGCI